MSGVRNVWTMETVRNRCVEEGDCVLWAQALNSQGYPQASINGKNTRVQRFIFTDLMGKQLRRGYVVSYRCRNRRCCAPGCLYAISYSERIRKAYASGTRKDDVTRKRNAAIANGWASKLNMTMAREIRARRNESNAHLGREFNCHPKTIAEVKAGRAWQETPSNSSVFTWRMAA